MFQKILAKKMPQNFNPAKAVKVKARLFKLWDNSITFVSNLLSWFTKCSKSFSLPSEVGFRELLNWFNDFLKCLRTLLIKRFQVISFHTLHKWKSLNQYLTFQKFSAFWILTVKITQQFFLSFCVFVLILTKHFVSSKLNGKKCEFLLDL